MKDFIVVKNIEYTDANGNFTFDYEIIAECSSSTEAVKKLSETEQSLKNSGHAVENCDGVILDETDLVTYSVEKASLYFAGA